MTGSRAAISTTIGTPPFLALGYSPEDWRRFEADLRSQHLPKDATPEERTSYGQKYAIRATLAWKIRER